MPLSVTSAKSRLDALFSRINDIDDLELQAHWARYLCVLASGFVEVSIRAVLTTYVRDKASPPVVNYVEARLSRFQNAKVQRIVEEVSRFSPEWGKELDQASRGPLKDAVDSLVANRNLIAHGQDVGITYARVREYFDQAHDVIEILHHICTHGSAP